MLNHFLTISLRLLLKNRSYYFFSIVCLGLAFSICIIAFLNFSFDTGFDHQHENVDRIFRIDHTRKIQDEEAWFSESPTTLATVLNDHVNGIERSVRINFGRSFGSEEIVMGQTTYSVKMIYADSTFFDVFTFPLVHGNYEYFKDKKSIYISEKLSHILFGNTGGLDQWISVLSGQDLKKDYIVRGIFKDHPLNSSFSFDAVIPLGNSFDRYIFFDEFDWKSWVESTFVLIAEDADPGQVQEELQFARQFLNSIHGGMNVTKISLTSLADLAQVHGRYTNEWYDFQKSIPDVAVYSPMLVALLILLFAVFNHINILLAIMAKRMKELGIRYVFGGNTHNFMGQLMTESTLLTIFAILVSLGFTRILMAIYNPLWVEIDLSFDAANWKMLLLFIMILLLFIDIIGIALPLLLLSQLKITDFFSQKMVTWKNHFGIYVILMVQFGIAAIILLGTIVFEQNTRFLKNFDLGLDADQLIYIEARDPANGQAFISAISDHHMVESICSCFDFWNSDTISYGASERYVDWWGIGPGCFETMGFRLKEGSSFSLMSEFPGNQEYVIVNEEFVRVFDMDEPIGSMLILNHQSYLTIIGVIRNVYQDGPLGSAAPLMLRPSDKHTYDSPIIRIKAGNLSEVNDYLEETWNRSKVNPDHAYSISTVRDDLIKSTEQTNQNMKYMALFFTLVTLFFSLVGLNMQISLQIAKGSKRYAIHRIHGASLVHVIWLASRRFLLVVVLGSLIGIWIGYQLITRLMQNIWTYYTALPRWLYIIPILFLLFLSLLIFALHTQTLIKAKPSEILKQE